MEQTDEGHRACFLKRYEHKEDYIREVAGIRLAQEIADNDDRFFAARILLTNDEQNVVVTSELKGESLDSIFKSAYRRDKNFFRSASPRNLAKKRLNVMLQWLGELNKRVFPADGLARDHSIVSIRDRIITRLDYLFSDAHVISKHDHAIGVRFSESVAADHEGDQPERLQFGDPTFGNFIFQGDRLGVIDFEEIGPSSLSIDTLCIGYWLDRASERWQYWDCAELREICGVGLIPDQVRLFFALQLAVNRCVTYCQMSGPGGPSSGDFRYGAKLFQQCISGIEQSLRLET